MTDGADHDEENATEDWRDAEGKDVLGAARARVSEPERRRSGFATIGLNDTSVDVSMLTMAADGGTVRDPDGRPMAGQTLRLLLKDAAPEAIATQKTDASGRFRFPAVPARAPLVLVIGDGMRRLDYCPSSGIQKPSPSGDHFQYVRVGVAVVAGW